MNTIKPIISRAVIFFALCTLLCGVLYTSVVTGMAQAMFPYRANGSIIEVNGKKYGSDLLGQAYTDPGHLWGRIMNADTTTYTDAEGKPLLYAGSSNLSPASKKFDTLVAKRVQALQAADPERGAQPVPVDLVTVSASGLDPHVSPAAAEYQVPRIAHARGMAEEEVRRVIRACTDGKLLGIFGEKTVNVLRVNLMLDGVLS